jgi:predicted  nucleic acid-binding Zn-ribbon protein
VSAMDGALRRLDAALDALETAVSHSATDSRQREQLENQLQAFGQDRTRLSADLQRLRARSEDLETANREVSRRLERATETIRTVLASQER